jgi:hypothetical protein
MEFIKEKVCMIAGMFCAIVIGGMFAGIYYDELMNK